jgi:AraC family transcriptional regulator of adaptative response/methylated-DNA-[protein]-cysteine methyltransferase
LLSVIDERPTDRLSDAEIRAAGIDPARARRYFMKNYGMTFQAYSRGRRLGRSLERIRLGADLDDVALGHGFESHSGFRSAFGAAFGSTPGQSRATGHIAADWIDSPLGPLIAGATAEGVCLLEFTDRRMMEKQLARLSKYFRCAIMPGTTVHLRKLKEELREYFQGTRREFAVPLVFPGTPFQKKVWDELLKIPYGTTTSYERIAQRIGSPGAVRAVGTANGMNRIAIVIPCHRVVNKNGELGGYGGGLRRKQALLSLERGERTLL